MIQETRIPRNATELRSFLGIAGYFRRFVKGFAIIAASLHAATSTMVRFEWNDRMNDSFKNVKEKITSPPVLTFPNFKASFIVETGASSVALGVVLAQKKEDGKIHPVYYSSRTMNDAERKYSACKREALAVVFALKNYRLYLLSSKRFQVITDQQALKKGFMMKDIHGLVAR